MDFTVFLILKDKHTLDRSTICNALMEVFSSVQWRFEVVLIAIASQGTPSCEPSASAQPAVHYNELVGLHDAYGSLLAVYHQVVQSLVSHGDSAAHILPHHEQLQQALVGHQKPPEVLSGF